MEATHAAALLPPHAAGLLGGGWSFLRTVGRELWQAGHPSTGWQVCVSLGMGIGTYGIVKGWATPAWEQWCRRRPRWTQALATTEQRSVGRPGLRRTGAGLLAVLVSPVPEEALFRILPLADAGIWVPHEPVARGALVLSMASAWGVGHLRQVPETVSALPRMGTLALAASGYTLAALLAHAMIGCDCWTHAQKTQMSANPNEGRHGAHDPCGVLSERRSLSSGIQGGDHATPESFRR